VSIETFIRQDLGCDCPAQVFAQVQVQRADAAFAEMPGDFLVRVGGRLLVLVILAPEWRALAALLPALCERGRALRDSEGYNRFRLVVATRDPQRAARALGEIFDSLPARDARVHLHAVPITALPDLQGALRR